MWDTNGTADVKFVEASHEGNGAEAHMWTRTASIFRASLWVAGWVIIAWKHLGDKIAAFGPVSGVDIGKQPKANRKVPIMHIHGTGDDVFKYTGDPSHMAGGYPSIEEYVKKWAAYEGCDASNPQVVRPYPSSSKDSQCYPYYI